MRWSPVEEERMKRQNRALATKAQADWSEKNRGASCLMTTFAVVFLGLLGVAIALGMMGYFD